MIRDINQDEVTRQKMVDARLWPKDDERDPTIDLEAALKLGEKWQLILSLGMNTRAILPDYKHKDWTSGKSRDAIKQSMMWAWGMDITIPRTICRCLLCCESHGYIVGDAE
jgi:hypothetical protein